MKKHQPALLGGLFIGVLSSLPLINVLNCCCLWVIIGGVLTTYLKQQNQPEPIDAAGAALSGLLAGAIGGLIAGLVSSAQVMWIGGSQPEFMSQVLENMGDAPPEAREFVQRLFQGPNLGIVILVITIPMYAVFGMLGGLLGTLFFKKKIDPTTGQPA